MNEFMFSEHSVRIRRSKKRSTGNEPYRLKLPLQFSTILQASMLIYFSLYQILKSVMPKLKVSRGDRVPFSKEEIESLKKGSLRVYANYYYQ